MGVEREKFHGKPGQESFLEHAVYNGLNFESAELDRIRSGLELQMMDAGFLLFFFCLAVTALIFWIWMIVDCATKEPSQGNDKIVWIVIIVFAHMIGALIYYFVRRPQRIARYGS